MEQKQNRPVIALIDPSPVMQKMFIAALKQLEVELVHLPTVAAAQEYLQSYQPVLVFLSSKLPETDGLSFLRTLRRSPSHTETPVVLISSKDYMQDRSIAQSLDVMEFMVKPMPMQQIRDVVARCIQGNSRDEQ